MGISTEEKFNDKLLVVDIGASSGEFALYVASQQNTYVLAIEPLPDVVRSIVRLSNLEIHQLAIRNVLEPTTAIIARRRYSELTSFLPTKADLNQELWSHHAPLAEVSEEVRVPVESLESLLDRTGIPRVDFLKIDAQGLDFEVLQSAGKRIQDVAAVVLEVPYSPNCSLYEGEVSVYEVMTWAHESGFTLVRLVPNGGGEANLFLANNEFGLARYFELEDELRLGQCPTLKLGEPRVATSKNFIVGLRNSLASLPGARSLKRLLTVSRRN